MRQAHLWRGAVSSKVVLSQDENWFLCTSAVFLSWCGVSSVVRWSSVTARWSHVVCLWSLSTARWVVVGSLAPLVAVADGAVDCGSVESSTAPLVTRGKWSYRGVSSLVTLLWQRSYHGETGSLFGGHCQRCSFYRTFFIVLWTFLFCVWNVCAFYVLCVCVFLVCTHARGCLYEWLIDWLIDWLIVPSDLMQYTSYVVL